MMCTVNPASIPTANAAAPAANIVIIVFPPFI